MAEGNLDQGAVTRESAQVSVGNEAAAKSKVALAEPVDGAVSEKETVLKAEAAPRMKLLPRTKLTLRTKLLPR